MKRCDWCGSDELYQKYHDEEWGIPQYDSLKLFELINLEGAQAGLSWITILRKREHYQKVFLNFQPEKIIQMTEDDVNRLLLDTGIVRNRRKVEGVIKNAHAYLKMKENGEDFSAFCWSFVEGTPMQNHWDTIYETPSQTKESVALSKALKKKGFTFVGPTIVYAFMQAAGLVNDHITSCFRYPKN